MNDVVVGTWYGRAGPSYPIRLEVEFRRDGTYRATAHQLTGAETTEGRFMVLAGSAPAIVFAWPSTGGGPPLTERVTVKRVGDQLLLDDPSETIVLTKRT